MTGQRRHFSFFQTELPHCIVVNPALCTYACPQASPCGAVHTYTLQMTSMNFLPFSFSSFSCCPHALPHMTSLVLANKCQFIQRPTCFRTRPIKNLQQTISPSFCLIGLLWSRHVLVTICIYARQCASFNTWCADGSKAKLSQNGFMQSK